LIDWGMQGKSVPRQERKGSERAQVASVAGEEAPRPATSVALAGYPRWNIPRGHEWHRGRFVPPGCLSGPRVATLL